MKAGTQPVQGLVRKNPISLKLGFSGNDYGYAIDLGLPRPDSRSNFSSDPEIKSKANGPVNGSDGPTPLRFATVLWSAFETTAANGGRPTSISHRSTA